MKLSLTLSHYCGALRHTHKATEKDKGRSGIFRVFQDNTYETNLTDRAELRLPGSYLKDLGMPLLRANMQRRSTPAVGCVDLSPQANQVLHNEMLIGSHGNLESTLQTSRRKFKLSVI